MPRCAHYNLEELTPDFELQYKVTEKENDPASEKYLIATSEQPISVLVRWLWNKDELSLTVISSTPTNGSARQNFLSSTLASADAFAKRQDLMAKMRGEFFAPTSLIR
jgi:hypothetical protein